MSKINPTSLGRGYNHIVKVSLDDFRQIATNADQTVRLFTGDRACLRRVAIVCPEDLEIGSGGASIGASIGDATSTTKFLAATPIEGQGADAGTVASNSFADTDSHTAETLVATSIASGAIVMTGALVAGGAQTVVAGGTSTALSLSAVTSYVDADAGGDIFTLAAGTTGQIKVVLMKSATGVATVTPDAMAGGTSVTMDAAGESVMFQYIDDKWFIIGGNGYTII